MSLSKLSGDEQGIILDQLRNALEPRLVMYFSSANKELRALLPPAARQQLRTDYEEATALCLKVRMRDCKELRQATQIEWWWKNLSADDLATLAKLGSVLPALLTLIVYEASGSAGPDGVQRLAKGLVAGALPALVRFVIGDMHMGVAGASAFAAALDRGALPRLKSLGLSSAAIGDAGLAALAPALRRRPALEKLKLSYNPFGDEGLAALVAPPDGASAGTTGALAKLKVLGLNNTQISDAGCDTLVAALDSDALPALEKMQMDGCAASDASRAAVMEALERSMKRAAARAREPPPPPARKVKRTHAGVGLFGRALPSREDAGKDDDGKGAAKEMSAAGAVAFASVLALALAIPIGIGIVGMTRALLGAQPSPSEL